MKIKSRSHKKTYIITFVIFLLTLASGLLVYGLYGSSDNSSPTTKSIDDSKQNKEKDDDKSTSSDDTPSKPTNTSSLPGKEGSDQPAPSNIPSNDTPTEPIETPVIERANQSGSNIRIVSTLQQSSNGSCEASLTLNQKTVKAASQVVVGPSYYTCSFSIPVSQFEVSGAWSLQVSHIKGAAVATSAPSTVTISKG